MTRETHNVVCISTIDWDFIWQGHQEIMSALARQGHRVLFIENTGVRSVTLKDLPRLKSRLRNWKRGIKGIRKVSENLYVYSPLVLPFPYSRVARLVNKAIMALTLRRWTATMHFENPIVWTWLPTGLALELIRELGAQLLVYYCCDNFEASSPGSKRIRETEDRLIREADLVFAHSKALFDRCRQFSDQVYVFQYGFNREVFAPADDTSPPDLEGIRRPILGYVGGVHKVVDLALLNKIAQAHPDKSLVFVGPLQTDVGPLADLPNAHFLGQKRYEELPAYIKHFDVCLIPYVLNDYTRNVYPTKLNEYLIMGKPVVSTQLPEVDYFNQCHQHIVSIAESHEAFLMQVQESLRQDSEALRAKRIEQVAGNAWDEKIKAMNMLIEAKLEEKAKTREQDWQQVLMTMYRTSRRKILMLAAVGLSLYGLLFHTSVVWMLAEPLRMVEPPQPAEAIAVLGGGIGESGVPGETYQDKVKQAVELYKRGYANTVIFSSGASYVFKEARVMKALAVSLGIPEDVIILEEQGGGNYASLLNVQRIMESHHWTRMLLVTSRYNGVRSRLVATKHLSGITVTLTPAEGSLFFGDESQVDWRHVNAISHEYLAIVYYWLKGYV